MEYELVMNQDLCRNNQCRTFLREWMRDPVKPAGKYKGKNVELS